MGKTARSQNNQLATMEVEAMKRLFFAAVILLTIALPLAAPQAGKQLRAGAATSNITPWLGLYIAGGMQGIRSDVIDDELYARCLVLDNGETRLAFVVIDSCAISRETLDEAKRLASKTTGIPADHMLMSATHTHSSAPATPIFQSEPDPQYVEFLKIRIADTVRRAVSNLAPAEIGWGVGAVPDEVFNRRWFVKGQLPANPVGGTDKAKMNPSPGSADLIEPTGPVDPAVTVLAVRTPGGRPVALLANYSLHYVGGPRGFSADYFGVFADRIQELLKADRQAPPFVGILSNGTSGNINNINFRTPRPKSSTLFERMRIVADKVAQEAARIYQSAQYHAWLPLDIRQVEIRLGVRKPTDADIQKAKETMAKAAGPQMKTLEEVYARETVLLANYPAEVPVILQALRIGDLAIGAIPAETFVEVGLELREKSGFPTTFTVSLANGYNGYLPTVEQHRLGGYETWRARSSYLEEQAAPKIVSQLGSLFKDLKR
jgi:hypothetical protein